MAANKIKVIIFLICLLFISPAYAYDIIYCGPDPADEGTVAAMQGSYNEAGIATVGQRWKTTHVLVDTTGTATHFLIRIGTSSSNSLPVGYAVYASTGAGSSNHPGDTPLIRGYQSSYTFTQTGWYAFPFLNDGTIEVTQNDYLHITFMINANELYSDPDAWRISTGYDNSDKWFPKCGVGGATNNPCLYDSPPGVGTEPTYAVADDYQISAGWQCGLLITTASGGTGTISASGSITIGPAQ